MNDLSVPNPEILDRILRLQTTLHSAPDKKHLLQALDRGLSRIPGIAGSAICLNGKIEISSISKPAYASVCSGFSKNSKPHTPCTNPCLLADGETYESIPIHTGNVSYGSLIIEISDPERYAAMAPHFLNTANIIALIIENRLTRKTLETLNRDLEQQVLDKTAQQMSEHFHQSKKMEAISTLAGGIAHDFNNMLGILMGNAELAIDDVPDWLPAQKNLNEIRTICLQAKDLVQQILSFSRPGNSPQNALNLGSVVQESLKILRSSIPETIKEKKSHDPSVIPTGDECILFVDDQTHLAKIGHQMLERLGYRVEAFTDPTEALERFRSDPDRFDLVITDMSMPQMTGATLATELMNIRPKLPIIISTGFSEQMDEDRAHEMGIRAYLEKPLTQEDLSKTIRRILDGG